MRRECIETGKTVDDAINAACEALGFERDKCEWEIIDLPKKSFLGLKMNPARVKVWIDLPDEKPAPEKKPEPVRNEAPVKAKSAAPEQPKAPRSQEQKPSSEPEHPREKVTEGFTEKEIIAMEYVRGIVREFGLTAEIELYREGGSIYIDIVGSGMGGIIGRRGEALDSIQYLTGLVANRLDGEYLRVTVDCGNYRSKRKDTLEVLAKKLAAQVLKTNVSKTLEPMNPFERRVIHATVSGIEGVSSASIGEEPNRRVVITSPTARRPSRSGGGYGSRERDRGGDRGDRGGFRGRDDRRGGRGGDRRRPGGDRRSPAPKAPEGPPKQTPESAAMGDAPIGKLDLE